ncbi:MAG: hypothetical protein WAQ98_18790 [Blastocatellia bacterium]
MVEKVKLKTEYKPERCEICHQADYFNPETNSCSRCAGVTALATNQEKNLSSKKQIPYYSFYVEDDYAKKQALKNGLINLFLGLTYSLILSKDSSQILFTILISLVFIVGGVGNLIDWHCLRSGRDLILENHRKLLSQAFMLLVIVACIGGQLFLGKIDVYLSMTAMIFLVFSFGEYYKLHKKANEANIETK